MDKYNAWCYKSHRSVNRSFNPYLRSKVIMKNVIVYMTVLAGILGFSVSSVACNRGETLQVVGLQNEPGNITLGRLGYDFGAIAGLAAQITQHFAQEGCRVNQNLIMRINPGTRVDNLESYVQFR